MRNLAVIPARGGSKRVPRKNILECAGKPLIVWTVEAAIGSQVFDDIVISTDDPEIEAIAVEAGAVTIGLRTSDLATDIATMPAVFTNALERAECKLGCNYEVVTLLQPTSPLRNLIHIQEAVDLFVSSGAGSVVSVSRPPHQFHPWKLLRHQDDRLEPFMDTPYEAGSAIKLPDNVYGRNGPAILITRDKYVRAGSLYGNPVVPYVMSPESSVDIDTVFDFKIADLLLRSEHKNN